ncbi:unnamed protein product, partial [Choristocarpus tenellus]
KIDVLVLYTAEAIRTTAQQLETEIVTSFVDSNLALQNSDVDLTLNLVHVEQTSYVQSGLSSRTDLSRLRFGSVDGAFQLRNTYSADLVQLVGNYNDYCGIAYLMGTITTGFAPLGVSVVHRTCLDNFVPLHEFGHNLGCHHDEDNAPPGLGYRYGYRYCEGTDLYRTVMSYSCPSSYAPVAPYMSNPDIDYLGKPTG